MSVQPRVKPGVPTGGQYAPWGRDESDGLGDIVGTGFDDGQAVSGEDAQIVMALSKAVLDDPNIEAIRRDGESWVRFGNGMWTLPSGEVVTSEELLAGGQAITPDSDLPIGASERLASGRARGALLQNLDGGWGAMGRSDTLAFTASEHATFAGAEAALVAWDQNTHPQRWGTIGKLDYGSRTPWGPAQHVNHPAPRHRRRRHRRARRRQAVAGTQRDDPRATTSAWRLVRRGLRVVHRPDAFSGGGGSVRKDVPAVARERDDRRGQELVPRRVREGDRADDPVRRVTWAGVWGERPPALAVGR